MADIAEIAWVLEGPRRGGIPKVRGQPSRRAATWEQIAAHELRQLKRTKLQHSG